MTAQRLTPALSTRSEAAVRTCSTSSCWTENGFDQRTRTAPASPMAAVNRASVTRGTAVTVNTEPFAMDSR